MGVVKDGDYPLSGQRRIVLGSSHEGTKPRAVELFAGVGGFRLGLAESWDVVWSNQWEPTTNRQQASEIYVDHFGEDGHVCQDICEVLRRVENEEFAIPDHDLLVAGFPCQDYSVARVLSQAAGLTGKKGILWWSIHELLSIYLPRFVLLENVDRLLKSPANQRGRDFAIILASLARLGYRVQWRVVNAADYGFPQRRRRVFMVGELTNQALTDPKGCILSDGVLARSLPVSTSMDDGSHNRSSWQFELTEPLYEISEKFGVGLKVSPFHNAGVIQGPQVYTYDVEPDFTGYRVTLEDILQRPEEIDEEFFIPNSQLAEWTYLKGAKKEPRTHRGSGTEYIYSEGAIRFPDPVTEPSRTILTGEGGPSPSRFKHVIVTPDNRLRRLTPVEMERLNGFDDGWTKGLSNSRRAFLMGNALVVGVVAKIGAVLRSEIDLERPPFSSYELARAGFHQE